MNSMQELNDVHRKAITEVFQEVGRSVLMYQRIERQLKVLLPNLIVEGDQELDSHNPFEEVKQLLASKKTLGPLMERLRLSIRSSHPEGLEAYFHRVVGNRNELIHSFYKLSFGSLTSVEACDQAIHYLDGQHEYAAPLRNMLRKILEDVVESLGDD